MQDQNSGNFEGSIAWTYPCLINDIYLCGDTYLNLSPTDRSEIGKHYSHYHIQKYYNWIPFVKTA